MDNNQALDFNDEKEDRMELRNILPQKIPKDQKVTYGRNCILIAMVLLCILCYTRNQYSNILQVTAGYFVYADKITKGMVENLYCMSYLVIYETI